MRRILQEILAGGVQTYPDYRRGHLTTEVCL